MAKRTFKHFIPRAKPKKRPRIPKKEKIKMKKEILKKYHRQGR